jgi:hypothetical protein
MLRPFQAFFTLLIAIGALYVFGAEPASQATTKETGVSIKVQSARVTRLANDLQKQFNGRYYMEGSPGVTMQLLLTFDDLTVLPLTREAVNIDTFIDDTYQNLMDRQGGYQGNEPAVSDDGRMVLLQLTGNRGPSDDATRVFVRGSLQARAIRGELKVAKGKLPLTVGEKRDVGPFKVTVRSVSDNGSDNLSIQLFIENDPGRIQKVRATRTQNDPVIQPEQTIRYRQSARMTGSTVYVNINGKADSLPLELTYAEKVDDVRVPFEAQVDMGVTKAGPIDAPKTKDNKAAQPKADVRTRPWPPPPVQETQAALPERRSPFDPSTRPVEARAVEKSAVDLFSLTIGKPAPKESDSVKWQNPPSPNFRASGFTIARLMVSTPGTTILSVPPDGITISRFEDDKGKHEPTFYSDQQSSYSYRPYTLTSPDGQQALVTISMTSAPTFGASSCTLAGVMRANVARGEHTTESKPFAAKKGQSIQMGPYTFGIGEMRLSPPMTPGQPFSSPFAGDYQAVITINGPADRVRGIEVLDAQTKQVLGQYRNYVPDRESPAGSARTMQIGLRAPTGDNVLLRATYYDKAEVVEIPFDITTGIGL